MSAPAKYRVMVGISYAYVGADLQTARDKFASIAEGCTLEDSTHEITTEPFIMAINPDDGQLVGTFYGINLEDYNGKQNL